MLTEDGFCTSCQGWLHAYPGLACPWCADAATNLEIEGLTERDTVGSRLRLVNLELDAIRDRERAVKAMRRQLAREAIAQDSLIDVIAEARTTAANLERWARRPKPPTCPNGHLRTEHGYQSHGAWACRLCPQERPKATPKDRKKGPSIRQAWKDHERRLEQRRELARTGELPDRLAEPLPPPVAPPER